MENKIEKKEVQPSNNDGAGVQPEAGSIVERANAAAERLEKALAMEKENLARREALYAREQLSGRSFASAPAKTKEQEQKEKLEAEVADTMKRFGFNR